VFVDGCFWHGCPEHGSMPVSNRDYWQMKLTRNSERDAAVNAVLGQSDWSVVRIWEHAPVNEAVEVVQHALLSSRAGPRARS
jgi:DNA mismatch endonuclease (patch repair protein)